MAWTKAGGAGATPRQNGPAEWALYIVTSDTPSSPPQPLGPQLLYGLAIRKNDTAPPPERLLGRPESLLQTLAARSQLDPGPPKTCNRDEPSASRATSSRHPVPQE